MLKQDLIEKNPLRVLNPGAEKCSDAQRMGLVIARAGIGKTALLVQMALDSLLRGNQVLHVSIGQSLEKTKTWYDDLFKDMAKTYDLENISEIEQEIMQNRMIMTFNATSYSLPKLEERLNDLVAQGVFDPHCIVVDGFDFASADREALRAMRDYVYEKKLQVWFTATTHRDDTRKSADGVPAPCHEVDDLFDTIINLRAEPKRENLILDIIKDATGRVEAGEKLKLDPATMLVKSS
jgi:KaiC/GvpD/RAD55 family RecA-like ATPase